ncbi:MAG: UDP-N-acetylmuramate dehydrogenase [Candidatus Daviesbacteria bacterium]|nr:UDP-N-acetylmuramate dehydrogenase [Candidatus Daviesbacteria bacterium]
MISIQENIPLAPFTTFDIGGPAKYFLVINNQADLIEGVKWAKTKNLPVLILGSGSNLLISDEGFAGLVIKNDISGIKKDGELIVQGGTKLSQLVDYSIENGLAGIQKMAGIPGTVGGAIFGNAGAYGQTIADYLTEVAYLDSTEIKLLPKNQCEFAYRESIFKRNSAVGGLIILEAYFKFPKGDTDLLSKESLEILAQRMAKYPQGLKCPGSFFKNIPVEKIPADPAGAGLNLIPKDKIVYGKVPAGVLLDLIGAKGKKIGDIEVSNFHANLIINKGHGKASDVWQLSHNLMQEVKEKFGIILEPEVQFINLPPL